MTVNIYKLKRCRPDPKNDGSYDGALTAKIFHAVYWDGKNIFACAHSPIGKPNIDIEPIFQSRLLSQLK